MIQNGEREGWLSLSCSKLLVLLRKAISKNTDDFYCLNCLHSLRTQNKIKSHKKIYENKDLFGIIMPSEKDNMLEFSKYVESNKMPYIICCRFQAFN